MLELRLPSSKEDQCLCTALRISTTFSSTLGTTLTRKWCRERQQNLQPPNHTTHMMIRCRLQSPQKHPYRLNLEHKDRRIHSLNRRQRLSLISVSRCQFMSVERVASEYRRIQMRVLAAMEMSRHIHGLLCVCMPQLRLCLPFQKTS